MYHNPYPSGHTGYGGAGAPSGPPRHPASAPPGSYSAHHESLSIASNPEAFANMFRSHLASLTFNSKPIITNLTILAHEHVYRMSTVVARCLEEHILNSAPGVRLPALYLLDSICKNIGPPYTILFSERVGRMFLETYRLVEAMVKMRMEELLATWRDGGEGGRPLFGEGPQWTIERALFGSQGMPAPAPPHGAPANQQQGYYNAPQPQGASSPPAQNISKARAVEEIDRLLALRSRDSYERPGDSSNQAQMTALRQLRTVVQTTALSPDEMEQIHAQLAALANNPPKAAPGPPPPPPGAGFVGADVRYNSPVSHAPLTQPGRPPMSSPDASNAAVGGAPANNPLSSLGSTLASLSSLTALAGSGTPPPSHPPSAPPATGVPNAASDLIKSLMQAGLLPGSQAAAPVEEDQDADYVKDIMALDIKATSADLQRPPPNVDVLLHKHLPLQCRQCSNRYPQGDKGKRSMDVHLDWHFRQNRRAKDSIARGQSRTWLDRLNDWIRGGHDDSGPTGRDGARGEGQKGGSSAAQEAALRASFAAAFVVAPTDPEKAAHPCPICKEPFKSEWSEEEEEWLWRNAQEVDGTYYHASCHYSARTLSESVRSGTPPATDGVGSSGSRVGSRAGTPQAQAQAQAGPVAAPSTTVDPVTRVKEEEGVSGAGLGKRKGSPALGEEGDGGTSKKVASF